MNGNFEPLLTASQTRCLLAVLALLERDGRVTVRGISTFLGVRPNATVGWLRILRAKGLVTWTDGLYGTLRSPWKLERV